MQAVLLVRKGWSIRKAARYYGFHHTAVMRWVRKAPSDGRKTIATESSRPHRHPRALPARIVTAIRNERKKRRRCAEVIHETLRQRGIPTSLSSVKRTLKREYLLRERSPWKKWHFSLPRPKPLSRGDLVQIDTIHMVCPDGTRWYVYTLIDVFSRWAYAEVAERISAGRSVAFVRRAECHAPFKLTMLQSDHGSEFSTWFTNHVSAQHRHSRVRKPNDNAHIERFNRTLQDECFRGVLRTPKAYAQAIKKYLPYYNGERLHLGLNLKTPLQVVLSC